MHWLFGSLLRAWKNLRMHLAFVDDSTQKKPSRPGFKGQLVAAGALCVPADNVHALSETLDQVCVHYGFPLGEEFKWSPGRQCWMHGNLIDQTRQQFFKDIIEQLTLADAFGTVVLEDDGRNTATSCSTAQQDVIVMLIERIANRLRDKHDTGVIVADRPGGDRRSEDAFIADCLETLTSGTDYVQPDCVAFVVAGDSKTIRLLQTADLLTSCLTAYVGGEKKYSPDVAKMLMPLLADSLGRKGGYGVKIHPDFSFGNLYHWLFQDEYLWKSGTGSPLPLKGYPYANGPDVA